MGFTPTGDVIGGDDYEGSPEARPLSREELQRFLDYADDEVERAVKARRKRALAAYRDATMFKVIYSWGLFSGGPPARLTCICAARKLVDGMLSTATDAAQR
jgi:hypothetical protein